jgi:hypothetical protein
MGYYLVRSHLGLAKAFHALRMGQEQRVALAAANHLLALRGGYSFDFVWEGGDAQAYFDVASSHAAIGNETDALLALGKALGCGWRDLPSLSSSDFARLRGNHAFEEIVAGAMRYTDLPEPDSLHTQAILGLCAGGPGT